MQNTQIEDVFNLDFVPEDTPLYKILTKDSNEPGVKGQQEYSLATLSVIKTYLETGVIDIQRIFGNNSDTNDSSNTSDDFETGADNDSNIDIDELVDAFSYLLLIHKPNNFPTEYWLATLIDNWILDEQRKGNSPTDNRWLIDITDMAYKMYAYPLAIVNNPDYVVAGSYPLSLINKRVNPHDIDVFYVGDRKGLTAGDELFVQVRKPFMEGEMETIEDVCNSSVLDWRRSIYYQYNDGTTICHSVYKEKVNTHEYINDNRPTWQLILKKYPSAAHVLASFDIDCCKVCLIGTRLFALPSGYYAIKNNVVKLASNATGYNSLFRLYKYVNVRGYDVVSVGDDYELGHDEYYSLPEVVKKEDYYDYQFTYREFDQLIHIAPVDPEAHPDEEYQLYGYGDMEPVYEKYLPLTEIRPIGPGDSIRVWFESCNSRVRVFFHPLLSTPDEIKQAVSAEDRFTPELVELAHELIDNYNWTLKEQEPRASVDFTWYINPETHSK